MTTPPHRNYIGLNISILFHNENYNNNNIDFYCAYIVGNQVQRDFSTNKLINLRVNNISIINAYIDTPGDVVDIQSY